MAKLEAELDAAGLLVTPERPQPRSFTFADISKLHYLDCVIKVRKGTQQACERVCPLPLCPHPLQLVHTLPVLQSTGTA